MDALPEDAVRSRSWGVRHGVLAWLCLAAVIAYVTRNCIGVLESTIREDVGLTKEQMGWVMGSFFITYAFFQIPCGWLADRWGARRALSLEVVLWSVAAAMIAWPEAGGRVVQELLSLAGMEVVAASEGSGLNVGIFWWLMFARLLAGAAQAGIFPCSAIIIARWIPSSARGMATGFIAAGQQIGAMIAVFLPAYLLQLADWPSLFWYFALPGFLWAAFFVGWFRDHPHEHPKVTAEELAVIAADTLPEIATDPEVKERTPWLAILGNPGLWWICGQQFFRGAGYIFYGTWFPTFLQEQHQVTVQKSGMLTGLSLGTALTGCLLGGTISDWVLARTGSRRMARQGMAMFSLLACAGLIFSSHFVADGTTAVVVISAGAFCASLAGPAGYSVTIDMGGRHVATVFAIMNMAGNIGAALFPMVVPHLLELPGGWNVVLIVFGGLYFAAAVCWMMLGKGLNSSH